MELPKMPNGVVLHSLQVSESPVRNVYASPDVLVWLKKELEIRESKGMPPVDVTPQFKW